MPRTRLLSVCPLVALLTLGCGSGDASGAEDAASPASEAKSDAGGSSGGGASSGSRDAATSSADAGGGPGSSSGSGSSSSGGSSGTGSSDAGADASSAGGDAASAPSDAGGSDAGASTSDGGNLPRFSFFVTSEAAIRELSKDPEGFGGDLRFGESGAGAGLRGADKLCAAIAERGMAGAGAKPWRAFLSASTGGADGGPVHARDRIGSGPWYDRMGRLVGNNVADLISGSRPSQANAQIRDDLPNETGTPNHAPDGKQVDNHDTLTGSDANGRYVSGANTCQDWTSSSSSAGGGNSGPSVGHSWPRTTTSGMHWVSEHKAGGCGKGINTSNGTTDGTPTVGSGGGYGGFYCFALTP